MQVCYPTTPANYFHVLRRQVRRDFRKPLILMTPKSLLRHKLCVSAPADMGPNTPFHRVLPETDKLVDGQQVKRVVVCSGTAYHALWRERAKRRIADVRLTRLEPLYPFPHKTLRPGGA